MRINIETTPIEKMRYPSAGDYFYDDMGVLQVRVAEMGNEFYEKMVIIHELIEEALTKKSGISEQEITDFDLYYEERRKMGLVPVYSEPGFDENAPYRKEHTFSTSVEMGMCAISGEDWNLYDKTVNEL